MEAPATHVTVKAFASYREHIGTREIGMELPSEATVEHLTLALLEKYPGLVAWPSSLVVAVNHEYQDHGYVLSEGDEVAIIPPVSGGAA